MFNQLKVCLGLMRDIDYVVEVCVTAALPCLSLTRQLLVFARTFQEKEGGQGPRQELMLRVRNYVYHS